MRYERISRGWSKRLKPNETSGHATAAARTRIEEPGKLEFPERRLARGHVDPLRSTKDCSRLKFYADRADAQDLVGAVNLGLPLSDTRRDPPMQKLGIALDIRSEIERLFGAVRQGAIDPFAQHCRLLFEVVASRRRTPNLWQFAYVVLMHAACGAH
jgi:hypothetical protein